MVTVSRTMVLQVTADEAALSTIEREAEESARWMGLLFGKLYADKRNSGWRRFGPDVDVVSTTGKNYHAFLTRGKRLAWKVRGEALYPVFIAKSSGQRIPSSLPVTRLQLLSQRVATVWSNFLNGVIRPKKGLPRFGPVAIYHVMAKDFTASSIQLNRTLSVSIVQSRDKRYQERMKLLMSSLLKKTWTAVEVRRHDDGKWYAHVPYTIEVDRPGSPSKVMGIDRGIRNAFVGSVVSSKTELPAKSVIIRGLPAVQRMERLKSRARGLRSKADRGNKNARRKLKELQGKKRRIQETLIWTAASRIAKTARAEGAGALVVEDLSGRFPADRSRRMNRLVHGWGRGRSRDVLEWKAEENGLRFREVNPAGTSKTCPRCGSKDKKNRDYKTHIYTCSRCGYSQNDDVVGAINIARRGYAYFHSPRWAGSQSTPPAEGVPSGARGEDIAGAAPGNGDAFKPQSKQADGAGSATSDGARSQANGNIGSENPEKPTIGTADSGNGYVATSRQRARSEPEVVPKVVATIGGNENRDADSPEMGPLASTVRGPGNEPAPTSVPDSGIASRNGHRGSI